VTIAVSGGVDSMTLAAFAHSLPGPAPAMVHASSAAVPAEATERVLRHARSAGWALRIVNAGELDDERYRANPANRCYFCKTDLYGTLRRFTAGPVASGANLDDLGDWRPGLEAAREHEVRHPFVEAAIDKATIRRLAAGLGLDDVAGLPASPCLSSRVETGIVIEPDLLAAIHKAERLVAAALPAIGPDSSVRCRVRATGIVLELDPASLAALPERETHARAVSALFAPLGRGGPVAFAGYARGGAFLRGGAR
jgi:pyridinium-3,5-biscarboxylic acid mononucleotide sulfurtransferase